MGKWMALFFICFYFLESRIAEGGSAAAEDLTADYADGTDNTLGAPDLRLRRCHRLQPPSPGLRRAKEKADPPLAQRAEALPKIDPRKRSWDKAAMHVWAHYHQNQCRPFSWERSFRQARDRVCSMFWFLDFSSGPLIGRVHPD
jgi:hypothetical protein